MRTTIKRKYNFVYITTNLINGKQYIGDHSTDNLEKDNYLGSGTFILKAIKKYKSKNFKREILEFFETKQLSFMAQEKYIKQYNTLHPNGYNYSPTGGLNVANCYHPDKEVSQETRQRLSKSLKGKKKPPREKEHSNKIIETRRKRGFVVWNRGKKMDEKFKETIRKGNIGKKSNFKGRKHTDKSRKLINDAKKGKKQRKVLCVHCNRTIGATNYTRYHGDKCKLNLNK